MMDKKKTRCSVCGKSDHNKRTCPNIIINDTRMIQEEFIEESINISDKKKRFIKDLLDREAYDIPPKIFTIWIQKNRPIKLNELKYVCDKGLNQDSIYLYLDLVNMIDECY